MDSSAKAVDKDFGEKICKDGKKYLNTYSAQTSRINVLDAKKSVEKISSARFKNMS